MERVFCWAPTTLLVLPDGSGSSGTSRPSGSPPCDARSKRRGPEWNFIVREGGLMSYGPGMEDRLQQAARYIDRILNGAKPTALPAEPPTRYYLAVNLKTATTDPIRGASHVAILLGRSI
jgi:hypothetical protein